MKPFLNLTFTRGFHVQLLTFLYLATNLSANIGEYPLAQGQPQHTAKSILPTRWDLKRDKNIHTAPGKSLPALVPGGLGSHNFFFFIFVSPKTFLC